VVSGRELRERGFTEDVELAVDMDCSQFAVRRVEDGGERAFVAWRP
jgi:phosphosulfolactate phosphohydrolase-like enzyme